MLYIANMHINNSEGIKIFASHPDYKRVHLVMTMLAMLTNPQVHFNTAKFLAMTKQLPEAERKLAKEDKKEFIRKLERELKIIFANHVAGGEAFTQFIAQLDFDEDEEEADEAEYQAFIDGAHKN
jgi:hypothetical protein